MNLGSPYMVAIYLALCVGLAIGIKWGRARERAEQAIREADKLRRDRR